MGAIQFIENLDKTSLTISDADFEKNVEAAVSAIAEPHTNPEFEPGSSRPRIPPSPSNRRMLSPHLQLSEKSTISRPEVTPRNSLEAERAGPPRSASLRNSSATSDPPEEENAAVAGLLRTIQRPLSTIGRMFSDSDAASNSGSATTSHTGAAPRLPRHPTATLPIRFGSSQPVESAARSPTTASAAMDEKERRSIKSQRAVQQQQQLSAEELAARQTTAEAEEARRIQQQEHRVVIETLAGMFPDLDREVIDDVVRMKEGRYVSPFASLPHMRWAPSDQLHAAASRRFMRWGLANASWLVLGLGWPSTLVSH